jgi:hypothetical protein
MQPWGLVEAARAYAAARNRRTGRASGRGLAYHFTDIPWEQEVPGLARETRSFPPASKAPITTSGTGGRVGPTSNDAGDPSPIAVLFANADRGAAAPVDPTAGPRSLLSTPPSPC